MRHVVRATAARHAGHGINEFEAQRPVDGDGRVQRAGRLPRSEPHTANLDVGFLGGQQRDRVAVGGDDVAVPVGTDQPDLNAFHRRVDVARGAARGGLLTEHVPLFDRPAQLDLHAVEHGGADAREAELGERVEPTGVEVDVVCAQVRRDVGDVVNQEVRQQVSAMQVLAVADQRGPQRLVPEPGHQRAHQQRLHHRHLVVRWHLETAQLQQAEPAARTVGAVELVDAELGAVGVAGDVGEQVAQRPVGDPGLGCAGSVSQPVDLGERDLELIERLGAALVDPRRLRRGADEPAGEQVGQRGVALPVGQQRHQQVGTAQQRRVGRGDAAQRDVVAAAGAAVGAVDVERLGR